MKKSRKLSAVVPLALSAFLTASCASSSDIKIYALDPDHGLVRESETIDLRNLKCYPAVENSSERLCPYAALSWDDLRTLIELVEACED